MRHPFPAQSQSLMSARGEEKSCSVESGANSGGILRLDDKIQVCFSELSKRNEELMDK